MEFPTSDARTGLSKRPQPPPSVLAERTDGCGISVAPLRAAVVGAGYLGRFHARKYDALPQAELVAIVDSDPARAAEAAAEHGLAPCTEHRELFGRIDVASVVVPTAGHYAVAHDLLDAGIDVLLEKPMAATIQEARMLAALAGRRGCVLQIGHLERFNPVTQALAGLVSRPRFIDAQRVSPFQVRGTDVNVVLDLMIHDIDLILNLVGEPVLRVRADGISVLSDQIDIANARLEFEGGCVANLTASRVSTKRERKMRLFQADAYFAADFDQRRLEIRRRDPDGVCDGIAGLSSQRLTIDRCDPLHDEIASFLGAVRRRAVPVVSATDGCRALETALEISRQIACVMPMDGARPPASTRSP